METDREGLTRAILIDDSPATRRVLGHLLAAAAVTVVGEASDADTGIELAQRELPDLIFLDVIMPGEDGVSVLKRIKALGLDVRVVMVTSIAERDTVTICRQLGAAGYILKPFSREKIAASIAQILRKKEPCRGAKAGSD